MINKCNGITCFHSKFLLDIQSFTDFIVGNEINLVFFVLFLVNIESVLLVLAFALFNVYFEDLKMLKFP